MKKDGYRCSECGFECEREVDLIIHQLESCPGESEVDPSADDQDAIPRPAMEAADPITDGEVNFFIRMELYLIDCPGYFSDVFGGDGEEQNAKS